MSLTDIPSNLSKISRELDTVPFRQRFRLELFADCHLPSARNIVDLLDMYQQLMFPAVFVSKSGDGDDHSNWSTETLLERFQSHLFRLVCWTSGSDFDGTGRQFNQGDAARIVDEIAAKLPAVATALGHDAMAAYDDDPACQGISEVVICYPGFHALTNYRLAHEVWFAGATLLARMIAEYSHGATGIDIHPQASLGQSIFIDHGTGVVIGQTCHVGDHVKLYQGVTLGALSFPRDAQGNLVREAKRHPTIQDHVVIYANSTVLGGKTVVGHHSVIGSSVWLTDSVEPYTTVVMEKPKLRFRSQQPTAFDSPFDYQI